MEAIFSARQLMENIEGEKSSYGLLQFIENLQQGT